MSPQMLQFQHDQTCSIIRQQSLSSPDDQIKPHIQVDATVMRVGGNTCYSFELEVLISSTVFAAHRDCSRS